MLLLTPFASPCPLLVLPTQARAYAPSKSETESGQVASLCRMLCDNVTSNPCRHVIHCVDVIVPFIWHHAHSTRSDVDS